MRIYGDFYVSRSGPSVQGTGVYLTSWAGRNSTSRSIGVTRTFRYTSMRKTGKLVKFCTIIVSQLCVRMRARNGIRKPKSTICRSSRCPDRSSKRWSGSICESSSAKSDILFLVHTAVLITLALVIWQCLSWISFLVSWVFWCTCSNTLSNRGNGMTLPWRHQCWTGRGAWAVCLGLRRILLLFCPMLFWVLCVRNLHKNSCLFCVICNRLMLDESTNQIDLFIYLLVT